MTIYGIMPMVRNTYAGIKGVSEEIILAAEAMGVIIAGVRNMVVMTSSVAAIASFIGAGGLGGVRFTPEGYWCKKRMWQRQI